MELIWRKFSHPLLRSFKKTYKLVLSKGNGNECDLAHLYLGSDGKWYISHSLLHFATNGELDAPNFKLAKAMVQSRVQQELSNLSLLLHAAQSITIDALLEPAN